MEDRLPGGRVGGAVRVGETVRRPAGRWTPTIHRLLEVLVAAGVEEVPRPLGTDEDGREVISYIPGETVGDSDRWPDRARSDALVVEIGGLLRRVHDASRGFGNGDVVPWRLTDAAVNPGQVVCHNDVAPYNIVWRPQEGIAGLIDWDFAAPGDPREDLAYALWQFAPLQHPGLARRLGWDADVDALGRARALVDAYDLDDRRGLTQFVLDRMRGQQRTIRTLADEGHEAFQRHIRDGDLDDIQRPLMYVEEVEDELDDHLTG